MKIYENLDLNNLENEKWIIIEGFNDYQISNMGRIKRIIPDKYNRRLKILKQSKTKKDYLSIKLNNKSRLIHRLLLMIFNPVENMDELQVNHINGIKTDNRLENLEWCTNSENHKHAFKIGLECNKGENHPMFGKHHSDKSKKKISENNPNRLSNQKIIGIRNDINKKIFSGKEIAKKHKISESVVSRIRNGKLLPC